MSGLWTPCIGQACTPGTPAFTSGRSDFRYVGPVHQCAAVNSNPVVLLRGDLEHELNRTPLHPALKFFVDHPVPGNMFEPRVQLSSELLTGTPIAAFPRDCDQPNCLGRTAWRDQDSCPATAASIRYREKRCHLPCTGRSAAW